MQNDTWDDSQYRCGLCMQLFSDEVHDEQTPLIICENIHSICRACVTKFCNANGKDAKCPECRALIWKSPCVNRDIVRFLNRAALLCGACNSTRLFSCKEAHIHQNECSGSQITCPMTLSDALLSKCSAHITPKSMWDHCQVHHSGNNDHTPVQFVPAVQDPNTGLYSGTCICEVTILRNHMLYFTITMEDTAHRMCLHVVEVQGEWAGNVAIAVRCFDTERSIKVQKRQINNSILRRL